MPTDVDDAGETISAGRNENSAPNRPNAITFSAVSNSYVSHI